MSAFREAALSGFRWMAAVRLGAEITAFAGTIVLARLIPPSEYGRAIIALAFVGVTSTLFQDGLTSPLVQRKDVTAAHLRTTALAAGVLGAAIAAAYALVLPSLLGPLFGERTAWLVGLLWPVFLCEAVAVVPRAELARRLDFRALGLVELLGLVTATATTIGLAATGLDATAIVVGILAQAVLQLVILVVLVRPPRPAHDGRALREVLGFGVPAALSSAIFHAWRNVDYAVLGARLGAGPAGLYWRAYTLALDYPGKVSGIMLRLAFPLYARTESPEQMQRLRARIVRAHATTLYPPIVALIVLAPTLVPFLFGDRWSPAVEPAQLLAVASLFAVISTGIGPVMLAVGRARLLLAMNAWNLGLYGTTVLLLAPLGLNAVALGAVGNFALSFAIVQVVLHRVIGLSVRVLVADVAPAAVAGAVMLAVSALAAAGLREAGAPALVELVVVGAVGALAYVVTLRTAFRAAWEDITLLVGALLRRRLGAT